VILLITLGVILIDSPLTTVVALILLLNPHVMFLFWLVDCRDFGSLALVFRVSEGAGWLQFLPISIQISNHSQFF